MDLNLLHCCIDAYKEKFSDVHRQEIYKWTAVRTFQRNFRLDAPDFYSMLEESLSQTKNLLTSKDYWPKRMLLRNAERSPGEVRAALDGLFDGGEDLERRIQNFRGELDAINTRNFPELVSYQDDRAAMAYLALRYPDTYYFYKFNMFRAFCGKIRYPYHPTVGSFANVLQFLELCSLVREELVWRPADNLRN